MADERSVLMRLCVADGVGNVQRGCAGIERRLKYLDEEFSVAPRGVFGRELHVVAERASRADGLHDGGKDLARSHAQLVFHMDGARCDERVDARAPPRRHASRCPRSRPRRPQPREMRRGSPLRSRRPPLDRARTRCEADRWSAWRPLATAPRREAWYRRFEPPSLYLSPRHKARRAPEAGARLLLVFRCANLSRFVAKRRS